MTRFFRICAFAAIAIPHAFGLDREQTLQQFFHSRWTVREGAPDQIEALAQSADGYLWLGTATGLFRYDGVRFERYRPRSGERFPSTSISTLFALPTGGLWIGFTFGGASFLKDDRLTNYSAKEGLPSTTLYMFERDSEGVMWAATGLWLERLEGPRWIRIGENWNYLGKLANFLLLDRQGTLWVASEDCVLFLPRGGKRFSRSRASLQWPAEIAQAPNGTLWLGDRSVRPFSAPGDAALKGPDIQLQAVPDVSRRRFSSEGILFDRSGSLWVANEDEGVLRGPFPERLPRRVIKPFDSAMERFGPKDGLTGSARALLEDREGNVWVGTGGGLDRFRQNKLVQVAWPSSSYGFALVPGDDGQMWAGTLNDPMIRFEKGAVAGHGALEQITCGYRDQEGVIWWGGRQGLWRFAGGQLTKISLPEGLVVSRINGATIIRDVQAITKDPAGGLWVSIARDGIFRLADGAWSRFGNLPDLPRQPAVTMTTDSSGRVWFGYTANTLAVWDGKTVRTYSSNDGLEVGNVTAIQGSGRSVWIGGEFGLARFENGRFTMLAAAGEPFDGVSGIVERANGDVWLNTTSKVVQIEAGEIAQARKNAAYRVKYRLFDDLDGLPGAPAPIRPLPTMIAGSDGKLWLANGDGVLWIDPDRILTNPIPPAVEIESIKADGRQFAVEPNLRLPVRTANIEIDYTALSLSIPERVHFRYKLEGADRGWHDADARRQAFYPNPAPGAYRFRVIACNNDGVWNEAGAMLDFSVAPAWDQTMVFRLACVGLGILALWVAYRFRLRQVAAGMKTRFDERLAERTRLARDLHDTLLQTIQGSKMVADDTLDDETRDPVRMRRTLEKLSGWLEQAAKEGRAALHSLRSSTTQGNDLAEAFREAAEGCLQNGSMDIVFLVEGTARELHPIVRDEVYRIGYEAIRNACNHSAGSVLEVELNYARDFALRVRDDGKGIDPEVAANGKTGHFGLEGMRERAARIRGRLRLFTSPKNGTEIELVVPGNIVFRYSQPRLKHRIMSRWRRLFQRPDRFSD